MHVLALLLLVQGLANAVDFVGLACDRSPSLPFCAHTIDSSFETLRVQRSTDAAAERDKVACRELQGEYAEKCEPEKKEAEFCQAYENICVKLQQTSAINSKIKEELVSIEENDREAEDRIFKTDHEVEEVTTPETRLSVAPIASGHKKRKRINFTRFCKEFKNRFLYICPDPFRFGQKAILFCPIYSDHCHVPLPGKPVLPKRKSKGTSVARLCAAYKNYAENYCGNAFLLAQPQYRVGCEKYWKFCLHRTG